MGRNITFYILSTNIEHDTSKICYDFEYEPEKHDFDDWENTLHYYQRFHPEVNEINREDYPTLKEFSKALCHRKEEQTKLWNSTMHTDLWCPKCKLYKYGIWCCDDIIDERSISHRYSNPIWDSEWNIHKCYLGSSKTNFVRRFGRDSMIREISEDDVNSEYKRIENMDEPIRPSDIEAKKETVGVLDFLQPYVKRDDVYVLIVDE